MSTAPEIAPSTQALDALLRDPRLWRGQPTLARAPGAQPTGLAALDAVLPSGGWPVAALSELLIPADGVGELSLLLPTIARLTRAGAPVLLVAPPYRPYAAAWQAAGVDLSHLHVIRCAPKEAPWAAEQALRSAACGAVLCWPGTAGDVLLRRLQVAAESGRCLGFCTRPASVAMQPSPAALRLRIEVAPTPLRSAPPGSTSCTATQRTPPPPVPAQLRVLKCRGGLPPARLIALPTWH